VLPTGDLFAGGLFSSAGGMSANRIARWNGTAWSALGTGTDSPVLSLSVLPSGEVVAGGQFITAGGSISAYFARWTGTNTPWITLDPQPQTIAAGETLNLSATPANGYANVSFQWQLNGQPIVNGDGGASAGGGTVSGASSPLPSPTDGTPATLTITNAQPGDSGDFTAIFSNACGSITSIVATVTVAPTCPADYNQDGGVDGADLESFFIDWEAGDSQADVNQDGGVDGTDVETFIVVWEAGGC